MQLAQFIITILLVMYSLVVARFEMRVNRPTLEILVFTQYLMLAMIFVLSILNLIYYQY